MCVRNQTLICKDIICLMLSDVMIHMMARSHQSQMNRALKLDYILKIASAYFNEIGVQYFAVDPGYSSTTYPLAFQRVV